MLTGYRLKEKTKGFAPKMEALAHPHRQFCIFSLTENSHYMKLLQIAMKRKSGEPSY